MPREPMTVDGPLSPWARKILQSQTPDGPTVFESGIPMRDGIELAADVYVPRPDQLPAPVIVTVSPYGKEFARSEAEFYQSHGYVFVSVETRGRGKSEGEWHAFVNDAADTHDVIEWAASEPWSTGSIGTTGLSYMGWVQWAGASQRPPHLVCMISTSAAGRWQQEIPYLNGAFQLFFGWWVYLVRRRIAELHGLETLDWAELLRTLPVESLRDVIDPSGPTWNTLMEHDTLDDFWRSLRKDNFHGGIDVPCLHVTGWYDLEDLLGAFHHYEQMIEYSPAADRQRLLVGPWSHVKCRQPDSLYDDVDFGPAAAVDMDSEHLRWFDFWLKGIDNGADQDPPVTLFEPGSNRWRTSPTWPLSNASKTLHLGCVDGVGTLTHTAPPATGARSYQYDPDNPVMTGLDVREYPAQDVPLDQTANEQRDDVLSYTGEPLLESVTLSGWAHVFLHATSDREDTDWHVKITDVDESGRSLKVTQGCLRACHRDSLEEAVAMLPGQHYEFDIEMWPTHHVFLPGHRIRVTITSSDFPWFARNLNAMGPIVKQKTPLIATNVINHGSASSSHIVLPIELLP